MASAASNLRGLKGSSETANNQRFNAEAAQWDSNPFVHQQSQYALEALKKAIPTLTSSNGKGVSILEIGCGTGLLSCPISQLPGVKVLVAVDAAPSMIEVLKSKIEASAYSRCLPVCVLLEDPEDSNLPPADSQRADGERLKFDLIISHLVLHHIPELEPVLRTMLGCLKPGGQIALTDFEDFGPEAKRFHPEYKMLGVERHGVNAKSITRMLEETGFGDVNVRVAWHSEKRVERFPGEFAEKASADNLGEMMNFSYLLCQASKPS